MSRLFLAALPLVTLAGCATLTEPVTQSILVQAVEGHRLVANVGCLLSNDAGRWYVNAPGRVTVTRSASPLAVDCGKGGEMGGQEAVASRPGAGALWGNLVVSAGVGYLVDRQTGAGHDYPGTITIVMRRAQPVVAAADDAQGGADSGTAIF